MAGLNKFIHGTVWSWSSKLVLIISSDTYNALSDDVNCVIIKGSADAANINSIQCNQIHTINKEDLADFQGAIPSTVLTAVKAKIRQQLDMNDDIGILQDVRDTATKLVGQLAKIDPVYAPTETDKAEAHIENISEPAKNTASIEMPPTEEALPDNQTNDAKPDKEAEPKPAKKTQGKKSKPVEEAKPRRVKKEYSEEDIAFVLDEEHTHEEIMERFGFTDKRKVFDLRYKLKKARTAGEA